jgi:hypothetical protein
VGAVGAVGAPAIESPGAGDVIVVIAGGIAPGAAGLGEVTASGEELQAAAASPATTHQEGRGHTAQVRVALVSVIADPSAFDRPQPGTTPPHIDPLPFFCALFELKPSALHRTAEPVNTKHSQLGPPIRHVTGRKARD